ncbi:MAG: helix-turn-helix domain-containing protein [Clostridia bacterium]|nr:helix-turn-helix domain-containing protein [Clostridia bacterium]
MVLLLQLDVSIDIRNYNGTVERFDKDVLSKLCFVIGCDLKDIMS